MDPLMTSLQNNCDSQSCLFNDAECHTMRAIHEKTPNCSSSLPSVELEENMRWKHDSLFCDHQFAYLTGIESIQNFSECCSESFALFEDEEIDFLKSPIVGNTNESFMADADIRHDKCKLKMPYNFNTLEQLKARNKPHMTSPADHNQFVSSTNDLSLAGYIDSISDSDQVIESDLDTSSSCLVTNMNEISSSFEPQFNKTNIDQIYQPEHDETFFVNIPDVSQEIQPDKLNDINTVMKKSTNQESVFMWDSVLTEQAGPTTLPLEQNKDEVFFECLNMKSDCDIIMPGPNDEKNGWPFLVDVVSCKDDHDSPAVDNKITGCSVMGTSKCEKFESGVTISKYATSLCDVALRNKHFTEVKNNLEDVYSSSLQYEIQSSRESLNFQNSCLSNDSPIYHDLSHRLLQQTGTHDKNQPMSINKMGVSAVDDCSFNYETLSDYTNNKTLVSRESNDKLCPEPVTFCFSRSTTGGTYWPNVPLWKETKLSSSPEILVSKEGYEDSLTSQISPGSSLQFLKSENTYILFFLQEHKDNNTPITGSAADNKYLLIPEHMLRPRGKTNLQSTYSAALRSLNAVDKISNVGEMSNINLGENSPNANASTKQSKFSVVPTVGKKPQGIRIGKKDQFITLPAEKVNKLMVRDLLTLSGNRQEMSVKEKTLEYRQDLTKILEQKRKRLEEIEFE